MMYSKKQRSLAILSILLLLLLSVATLVVAIINPDGEGRLFRACFFAMISVPILLWIYIWLYGILTKKDTIATFFPHKHKDCDENALFQTEEHAED